MENNEGLEIAHELIQERARILYEQRDTIISDYITDWFNDLADWFEAERQIQREILNKELEDSFI